MFYIELNSKKFRNSHSKPKLSFLKKIHKNDNYGHLLDFKESTLHMNFAIFPKIAISAFLRVKFLKKIKEFTLAISFGNFRLKT